MKRHSIILIFAFLAVGAQPPGASFASELQNADLLIRNARLVLEDGSTSNRSSLVVANGVITSIEEGDTAVKADRHIDIGGRIVLPGFIDTHVHLLFRSGARDQASLETWIDRGLPDLLDAYLAAGITSVMTMGDYYPTILDVRDSINSGRLRGPRTFVVGPVFTAPGGHPAGTLCRKNDWCRRSLAVEVQDPGVARQRVRDLVEAGVDGIKAAYSGRGPFPKIADPVFAALIEETQENGRRVFVHSTSPSDFLQARTLGANRFAHTPALGAFVDVPSVPSIISGLPVSTSPGVPKREAVNAQRAANLRQLIDWGALIVFGTDLPSKDPAEALAIEINSLKTALTAAEIIASLTENAALFIGAEERLGKIAVGYTADLVVVDGDPFEDLDALTDVVMVFRNGEIVADAIL